MTDEVAANSTIRDARLDDYYFIVRTMRQVVRGELETYADAAEIILERLSANRTATSEAERYRAALQKIITEADSDDGLTAWDAADIARDALSSG
jgi:hypothetical protein